VHRLYRKHFLKETNIISFITLYLYFKNIPVTFRNLPVVKDVNSPLVPVVEPVLVPVTPVPVTSVTDVPVVPEADDVKE